MLNFTVGRWAVNVAGWLFACERVLEETRLDCADEMVSVMGLKRGHWGHRHHHRLICEGQVCWRPKTWGETESGEEVKERTQKKLTRGTASERGK